MSELSALNVRITGDASSLVTATTNAKRAVEGVGTAAGTATARTTSMSRAFGVLGNVSNQTRSRIQNTSFQLQDIAVQLQMGTRASTVFAQQLPQLAGGFGAVGAVIGTLAAIGIPALAYAFASAGDEAETMDDRLDALKVTSGTLKRAQDILNMSNADLVSSYGLYSGAVRDAARALGELAAAEAQSNLIGTISQMNDELRSFTQTSSTFLQSGTTYANAIGNVAEAFNIGRSEARLIVDGLTEVRDAMTFDERVAALTALQDTFQQLNISAADLPPSLRSALTELNNLVISTAELAAQAENVTAAASGMNTGVPLYDQPGGISLAPPTRRRSGAGSGSRKTSLNGQLKALWDSLSTQEEMETASHDRRLEQLRQFHEARMLTDEEYNNLRARANQQHAERLSQIDVYRYGTTLQRTGQFFGDMAGAFSTGNERMLQISKTFGAAQALISAWQGAAEALKLPFPVNLAAFAQVLSTGLGAVRAIQGAGRGGASAGAATAPVQTAQRPLQATLNLQGPMSDVLAGAIGPLFDQLRQEAGDRGYQLAVAR